MSKQTTKQFFAKNGSKLIHLKRNYNAIYKNLIDIRNAIGQKSRFFGQKKL